MWRRILILVVALIYCSILPTSATEDIDMEVTLPLGGLMKQGEWTRVEVKITNQGQDFSGTVQLEQKDFSPRDHANQFKQFVQVGKGETKKVNFEMPTDFLMNGDVFAHLQQGEKVIQTEAVVNNNQFMDRIGAVVDTNPNAFHFLSIRNEVNGSWQEYNIKAVRPNLMPEDAWILHNLDLLALGNADQSALNEHQFKAIKEWVNQGGILLLSTGAGKDKILKQFEDVMPISAGRSGSKSQLDELRNLSGQERLPITSLDVYNTDLPLFVSKQIGSGRILFVNYDVNAEPLASWQYNRQMWQHVLNTHKLIKPAESIGITNPMDYSLRSLSRFIPGVSTPAVEWLAVIWIVYILVVAPLLYFLLKRKDRREWAWGVIPLLAIVLSAGVYTIGRLQITKSDASYNVTSVTILDDHTAKLATAATFLTVSGGSYQVKSENGVHTIPLGALRGQDRFDNITLQHDEQNGNLFTYTQVPYLTGKQAVATSYRSDIGSFDNKLFVEQNQVKGSITNNTAFDMQNVYLDLGMQRFDLGSFKKGETKQVKETLKEIYLEDELRDKQDVLAGPQLHEEIAQLKTSITKNGVMSVVTRVVGVSEQSLPVISMVGKEHNQFFYNVFNQQLKLAKSSNGRVHYPFGTLQVEAIREEGMTSRMGAFQWEVGKGSVTFRLYASPMDLAVTKIEIPLDYAPYRPFDKEIRNVKTNSWEKVNREKRIILDKNVSDYINKDGFVEIRLSNTTNQRLSMPMPFFAVEGEER
ncbi:hypothetical protein [Brevibacillus sp. SYSU BS000544]|uniref:hypothetical protein n=1 Tax=Brevibacillus sp. SYSU BS000544 TaxID=3416443 RepID=UPI003CE471D9